MADPYRLDLPQRRRNYRFALTPLADAMFQLLIFFMLSTGLTPYSLLALQSALGDPGGDTAAAAQDAQTPPAPQPGEVALWQIQPDGIKVGGQVFGYEALDTLADALGTPGAAANVVLVVRPGAKVQDMTSVLARLSTANVGSVQVSAGEGN
ncbi:MAG: ExbD/TolR family protein [Maritimibacter sp.]